MSTDTRTFIRAQNAPWMMEIQLYIGNKNARVKEIVMEAFDPMMPVERDPSFHLQRNEAQTLMDDLWHCGLRPTEGAGSAGSLAATQSHLNDMRAIVAAKLAVKL